MLFEYFEKFDGQKKVKLPIQYNGRPIKMFFKNETETRNNLHCTATSAVTAFFFFFLFFFSKYIERIIYTSHRLVMIVLIHFVFIFLISYITNKFSL